MNRRKRILFQRGTLLMGSTLLVNAGNYLTNLLLGRWMGPESFSEAGLLITMMLMLSFIATGFQLTTAKYAALAAGGSRLKQVGPVYKWISKIALLSGTGIALLIFASSGFWRSFFNTTSSSLFIILGAGIPVYLVMSVNRGILQGKGRFKKLALTYQFEMWSRLILSAIAVKCGLGPPGVAAAITLSLVVALVISRFKIPAIPAGVQAIDKKGIFHFIVLILIYECSQILINNSDVVLVKHFFPPQDAGLYAALALVGRIVYFGTWTVVTILFPMVIRLEKENKPHLTYFFAGLGIVVLMSAVAIALMAAIPNLIVHLLFGPAYYGLTPYLWYYALATSLFACANVFVYYNISLERRLPVWISICAGIAQIILIWKYHSSFYEVISIQVWLMAVVLLIFIGVQWVYFKNSKR
ncbi:O-antigen/teichoic acid export membrane protein [Chitinophaga dinghuensis]|uniref:O-antigen/teichoic acid export membrane protein n=1 Tax=Chitinophaga dinghuensis TaxID=1539050 RepID=A0A327VSR0_9BACT|nr:oligosaccharide flippase family protein [Chitinophaga dinghuensis]RAJ77407.1 O-antigen/teichoic acid export membrane protein [Chitinophaga dinghuensis]